MEYTLYKFYLKILILIKKREKEEINRRSRRFVDWGHQEVPIPVLF